MTARRIRTADDSGIPTDAIESALAAYQAGAADAFDRLIEEVDGGPSDVCMLLHDFCAQPPETSVVGVRIPGYEVLREIGRGGMGVVVEARQLRTDRIVALKLLPHWASSAALHDRLFRRELTTLSRLNHPNIATLYDAEQTAEGLAFLVMERIDGQTLDTHAETLDGAIASDRRALLTLFVAVCRAIAFAHQKGVVHCDLKTKNVMIASSGAVKVLDFGLARLLDPEHGGSISLSLERGVVGTLAYLSPEQARGSTDEIDTRSDVYALGVMLYELIVGQPPYDVRGRPFPEIVRTICEREPAKPRQVRPAIPADLETILLKALEKSPERRYRSADAFADDIERFLAGLPIEARPARLLYQVSRFVRRHKLLTILATLFALTLMTASIVFAVQSRRIAAERDNAIRVAQYIASVFEMLDPYEVGTDVPVRVLLDRAAASVDTEVQGHSKARARVHEALGDGYLALGLYEDARREHQAAYDIRLAYYGTDDHVDVARSLDRLVHARGGDYEQCRTMAARALEIRTRRLGDDDPAVADSYETMTRFCRDDIEAMIALSEKSIAIRRLHAAQQPRELGKSLAEYGGLLVEAARYDSAGPILDEALTLLRRTLGDNHYEVVSVLTDLGEIALRRGDYAEAERHFRDQIQSFRRIFPSGHPRLAMALNDLADIVGLRGDVSEAERLYVEAADMMLRNVGYVDSLIKNDFGVFLLEEGRYQEARTLLEQVYVEWTGDLETIREPGRGYAAQNRGRVLFELNEVDQAERLFLDAEKVWRGIDDGRHPKLGVALTGLANVARLRGDPELAHARLAEAYDLRLTRHGPDHHETAVAAMRLAVVEQELGKPGAVDRARAAVEVLERRFGRRAPMTSWAIIRLAGILAKGDDIDAATSLYREAIETERGIDRENHPNLADALLGLAGVLIAQGDCDAAIPLASEALSIRERVYVVGDRRITEAADVLAGCAAAPG